MRGGAHSEAHDVPELDVSHLIRSHEKIRRHLFVLFVTQLVTHTVERTSHRHEPRVASTLRDTKGRVTHPQARVTTLLLVGTRTTPVLHEKECEVSFRLRQILGIHGAQRRVDFDRVIEDIHQLLKKWFAADLLKERFFHPDTLMASPTMVLPVSTGYAGVAQW